MSKSNNRKQRRAARAVAQGLMADIKLTAPQALMLEKMVDIFSSKRANMQDYEKKYWDLNGEYTPITDGDISELHDQFARVVKHLKMGAQRIRAGLPPLPTPSEKVDPPSVAEPPSVAVAAVQPPAAAETIKVVDEQAMADALALYGC